MSPSQQDDERHASDQTTTCRRQVTDLLIPRLVLCAITLQTLLALAGARPATAQTLDSLDPPAQYNETRNVEPAAPAWKGAFADSIRLLILEHAARVAFQPKTRRELDGPFLRDYERSVRWPRTWGDGDSWRVNYAGHPIHGAAAGFIWLDHEDGSHNPELGFSKDYWTSRSRALAWAAGYSLQFEFGPLSEASIGNVGLNPATTGWVDHVVTPVGALGFMVIEDVLDRYLIVRIESWTNSLAIRAISRVLLNPSRSLSNTAQGRAPWSRAVRRLR